MADDKLNFYFERSSTHQEILVDGAVGGPSPQGDKLCITVYTERHTIPSKIVHQLDENGVLMEEIREEREDPNGIQRVLQATLHMDISNAKSFSKWLADTIEEMESSAGSAESSEKNNEDS